MKMNILVKHLRLFFIIINLLLTAFLVASNSVSIDSRVDKSTIKIGDLIKYTVEVRRAPDVTLEMPELGANLGSFEIRDYQVQDPRKIDGSILESVVYTISTFDVGEFVIPPLTFYFTLPNDTVKSSLKTQQIKILVESLKPSETGDIRDIKQPLELPRDWRKIIIWSSTALAFLILLGVSFYIWRRKRLGKGILPIKVEPPRPAHEIAFEELNALKESTLLREGKLKAFYICMSEIIRKYVEGRYFIVALELTTHELVEELQGAELEKPHIDLFQGFLESCDLVKFAKFIPSSNEVQAILKQAFDLVEQTKLIYDSHLESEGSEVLETVQSAGAEAPEAEVAREER